MKWNPRRWLGTAFLFGALTLRSPATGTDAASLRQKALDEAHQGHPDEAIADWSRAIQLDPKNAEAYYDRGRAKDDQHDLDGAIADYSEAIDLDPSYANAYSNRGYARSREGDLAGATADYDRAISLNPRDAEAYNNRGNAKLAQDDFDGAIADYNEAIRLNPRHAHAYNGRANAVLKEGDLDQAITDYNQALRLDPGYAHAYNGRGLAELARGQFQLAQGDFTSAIRIDAKYAHAYANRGATAFAAGQPQAALPDLQKSAALDPTDLESRYLAWLILAAPPAQKAGADADLKAYLSAGRLDPWSLDLGQFLLGDLSEDQLLAAAETPDEKTARQQRCQAYFYIAAVDEMKGNPAAASDFFRRCLGTGQKDFLDYQIANARVLAENAATAPQPAPMPPALWSTGQVSAQKGVFLFAADKPVRGNSLGNVVLLGSRPQDRDTMALIFSKTAEKKLPVRFYGCLVPFNQTLPGHPEPLPTVEFMVWKLHSPSDPDVLPRNQKVLLRDLSPPAAPPATPVPSSGK